MIILKRREDSVCVVLSPLKVKKMFSYFICRKFPRKSKPLQKRKRNRLLITYLYIFDFSIRFSFIFRKVSSLRLICLRRVCLTFFHKRIFAHSLQRIPLSAVGGGGGGCCDDQWEACMRVCTRRRSARAPFAGGSVYANGAESPRIEPPPPPPPLPPPRGAICSSTEISLRTA